MRVKAAFGVDNLGDSLDIPTVVAAVKETELQLSRDILDIPKAGLYKFANAVVPYVA